MRFLTVCVAIASAITLLSNTGTINAESDEPPGPHLTKLEEYGNLDRNSSSNNHSSFVVGDSVSDLALKDDLRRHQVIARGVIRAIEERDRGRDRGQIEQEIYTASLARFGSEEQAQAVLWIVQHESSFNPSARNGRCVGLFQKLDSKETSVEGQIAEGLGYIENRYGRATTAKTFWESHRWY